jgi:hypothetical protein
LVIGLWLFYRSHADLGTNWSITLEVREQHRLITKPALSKQWIADPSTAMSRIAHFSPSKLQQNLCLEPLQLPPTFCSGRSYPDFPGDTDETKFEMGRLASRCFSD